MTATVLRKELHTLINTLPDHFIQAMMPLVSCIADEYWKPVIETDLTEEERAIIAAGVKEKRRDPSTVKPWKEVRRG